VGNYGLDQAYLRLKKEYIRHKTDVVILAVVPETIVRVLSTYRHYFEYGNTFAFKPRFTLVKGCLRLIPNPMDKEEKFFHIEKYISEIQKDDFFYKEKFRKDILSFPYSLSIIRKPFRHIPLIFSLVARKIYRSLNRNFDGPWEIILRENRRYCTKLYENPFAVDLLIEILKEFVGFGKEKGFIPVFVLLPYQGDIDLLRQNGKNYYSELIRRASEFLMTIDVASFLFETERNIYTNDFYGGHFNSVGNKRIADVLYKTVWKKLRSTLNGKEKVVKYKTA
jgi:hypothetical protein